MTNINSNIRQIRFISNKESILTAYFLCASILAGITQRVTWENSRAELSSQKRLKPLKSV